jgi:hypothetical protein
MTLNHNRKHDWQSKLNVLISQPNHVKQKVLSRRVPMSSWCKRCCLKSWKNNAYFNFNSLCLLSPCRSMWSGWWRKGGAVTPGQMSRSLRLPNRPPTYTHTHTCLSDFGGKYYLWLAYQCIQSNNLHLLTSFFSVEL